MYIGYRVQLDSVDNVVDSLMEKYGGFRKYIKIEANNRYLIGAVWRGNKKSVFIEVEGSHDNILSFKHCLYELVTHITTEESWEGLKCMRLISTNFNIKKNISKYSEKGTYSDSGYETDL